MPVTLRESKTVMNDAKLSAERRVTKDGEDFILQKHITLGGGPQNDRTTFVIYFGDRDGELLIGHVGRHLTGPKTRT